MMGIPRAALGLGLAGVLPFAFGALIAGTGFEAWKGEIDRANGYPFVVPKDGQDILVTYGIVIACFMAGVQWGFAAPSEARRTQGLVLSVIPALFVFFYVPGAAPSAALMNLVAAFLMVLAIDIVFRRWDLVPRWWLPLRFLLTSLVILCLLIGAFA